VARSAARLMSSMYSGNEGLPDSIFARAEVAISALMVITESIFSEIVGHSALVRCAAGKRMSLRC